MIKFLRAREAPFQQIFVYDFGALKWGDYLLAYKMGITQIFAMMGKHYQESVKNLFLLNCPSMLTFMVKALKPFIEPDTIEKIRICKGPKDYLPQLESVGVPLELVPVSMGGTNTSAQFYISDADIEAKFPPTDQDTQGLTSLVQDCDEESEEIGLKSSVSLL